MWTFRIFLCYYFVNSLHMGLLGVWCGMFVDWFFRSLLFTIRFINGKWMEHQVIWPSVRCTNIRYLNISCKVKKNPACRILRLRRVALATLFHSAAVRSLAERFLCHRTKFPMTQKKQTRYVCHPWLSIWLKGGELIMVHYQLKYYEKNLISMCSTTLFVVYG